MASGRQAACSKMEERVTAYLEGALSAIDRKRFEAHCRSCESCRAAVSQSLTIVRSLGHVGRSATPTAAEQDVLLGLFREHGLHRTGPRQRSVPLGLGDASVAPGDHLAYFWDSHQELEAAAGFLAAGVEQRETCILLGYEEANARFEAALERGGLDAAALKREGRLQLVSGKVSADALLAELDDRVKAAVDRGEPLVRILGSLGWGRPGWPTECDLLCLEARVTAAIHNLPTIVMCAYDVRGTPGVPLLTGGLECHPWTFRRGVLRPNDHYVPAERLLPALEGDSE